ncbi:hypothetical protein HaLaN_12801, partial [Haematococcus lacustris]
CVVGLPWENECIPLVQALDRQCRAEVDAVLTGLSLPPNISWDGPDWRSAGPFLRTAVQVAVDDGTLVRDFSRASPSPTCCSAACQYGAKATAGQVIA